MSKKSDALKKAKDDRAKEEAAAQAQLEAEAKAVAKPKEHPPEVMAQDFSDKPNSFGKEKSYIVRPGCALTSLRGVLVGGTPVKAKYFPGGWKTFRILVEEKGTVIEAPASVTVQPEPVGDGNQ